MAQEAWGRWGDHDERGALNLIDAAIVRDAVGLVNTGEVLSLAQPLSPRTPVPSHRAPMAHFMGRDGGDYAAGAKRPAGFQFAEDTVILPLQFATHVDALCHAWHDDQLYNGFPSTGIRSTTGATRCGVDKMGPIIGRGVLLDIAAMTDAPLARGDAITAQALEAAEQRAGVKVRTGDIVLVRTGWNETMLHLPAYYDGEPGLDVSAAQWLVDRDVAIVGADNFAVEAIPFPEGAVFPVHQLLIRERGIALLEGLMLQRLGSAGVGAFLFVATPLPIVGGTGSPLAPIAVL